MSRPPSNAIDGTATALIEAIRANDDPLGGVEDMLREFALSTKEGLALMVLAEALLRVPDARTADQFIEDKLGQGDFIHHETKSSAFLVNASAWALGMSARVIQPGETPQGTIGRLTKRLGAPAVRAATRQAMRLMGSHFVLGETIEAALARAQTHSSQHRRYSFDMLGEGARTAEDAARYQNSYASAIAAIGRTGGGASLPDRPGISVKLSALHPRFEAVSRGRVMTELVPRLIDLARQAKAHDLNFTVDAEEADRLELSLDVIAAAFRDPSLAGWDGFGLAIQAYQKRASAVIGYVDDLANRLNRRMMVRLVKGAYWDTEIKRAQERGLDGYPVFTRKAMTDLNYVACARQLLALRPRLFPQFATHNALTVATLLELAGGEDGFEFQRLHGMGEALYAKLADDRPGIACRTYAPVGSHRDLLAYLVRRLLENGANSSFVALAADETVPVTALLRRPADIIGSADHARPSEHSVAPRSLSAAADKLARAGIRRARGTRANSSRPLPQNRCPRPASIAGATAAEANAAISAARDGFKNWSRTPANMRAAALETAADLLRTARGAFHRAAATRGRQDAGRRAVGSPRGRRLLPLLRRGGSRPIRRRQGDAGADRREQYAPPARSRRIRRDLALEFSAGDLSGPSHGGVDGRQCRRRQARGTDAADCGRSRAAFARSRCAARQRSISCRATAGSARRWWRMPISPASSSPDRPRSHVRSTVRSPPRTDRSCR